MYKVFEINDCFEEYAMSYFLVGAVDKEDLCNCLEDIMIEIKGSKSEGKEYAKKILKDEDWRIKEQPHLFTDSPYKVLNNVGYIE